jgi:hypothetical protein
MFKAFATFLKVVKLCTGGVLKHVSEMYKFGYNRRKITSTSYGDQSNVIRKYPRIFPQMREVLNTISREIKMHI